MSYSPLSEIRVDDQPSTERINQPREQEMVQSTPAGSFSLENSWLNSIMEEVKEAPKHSKLPVGPKIPEVPDNLKNKKEACFKPLVVSIGPYHHGQQELSEMESLKVPMARQFVLDSKKDIKLLYNEVEKVTQNARAMYNPSSIERRFTDEEFTQMMFLDGCFILQFIHCVVTSKYENVEITSDQQVAHVKRDLLLLENQLPFSVLQPLMILRYENENEKRGKKDHGRKVMYDFLFYHVLHSNIRFFSARRLLRPLALVFVLLPLTVTLTVWPFSAEMAAIAFIMILVFWIPAYLILVYFLMLFTAVLPRLVRKITGHSSSYYDWQHWQPEQQQPVHLLELLYFICLGKKGSKQSKKRSSSTFLRQFNIPAAKSKSIDAVAAAAARGKRRGHYLYYSAKNLKKAGINFMQTHTIALKDVKCKSSVFYGTLELPSITIDVSTESLLFNLVAYETCAAAPDHQLWVTSYICFMDSLIDDAEDVEMLRSRGVLNNFLGHDTLVANLFNEMGSSLIDLDTNAYNDVKRDMNKQSESNLKKWIAEGKQTYFRSPWAFIALAAAATGLALTATQTYYTMHPPGNEHDSPPSPNSPPSPRQG